MPVQTTINSTSSPPASLDYIEQLRALHVKLGIPADYEEASGLPLCLPAAQLVATEPDFYDRPAQLSPAAFHAWTRMKTAALEQGVQLFLISAFRSLDYQAGLIERKLARGLSIEEILAVNAAPGYSEHHTGRAIDIGTSDCDALVEEFEDTDAFQWLTSNAAEFSFALSYPRNSPAAICYEPWHWCLKT